MANYYYYYSDNTIISVPFDIVDLFNNYCIGCTSSQLGDGTVLPDGVQCGSPLHTIGIHNGIVCYTGTGIGSTAFHHCFNCGYDLDSNNTVRTCQSNGMWSGAIPRCVCSKEAESTTGTIDL